VTKNWPIVQFWFHKDRWMKILTVDPRHAWTETLEFKTTWRVTFSIFGHSEVFSEIQRGISKIERRLQICHGFFEMYRPAYVNALNRKNRPGRLLHKKTRRRIIDRYLTGEWPTAISTAARATPGAVYCIITGLPSSVCVVGCAFLMAVSVY